MTFLHAEQFQMPTARRFTLSCIYKKTQSDERGRQQNPEFCKGFLLALPQNVQVYRACWVISILGAVAQSQSFSFEGDVGLSFSSHLFNLLAQGGTVTLARRPTTHQPWDYSPVCLVGITYRAVLASDADLTCAFCLLDVSVQNRGVVEWIRHHCGCPWGCLEGAK